MTDKQVSSALITGGGSGIGATLAIELAQRGCQVLISGRRASALAAVADTSDRIATCVGDVTDATHRAALTDEFAKLPEPRALVHTAGSFQTGLLDALPIREWRRSFETNVEARWTLSCTCAPFLDDGRILFLGSDAGVHPRAGAAAYSIAQSASDTLRRALQVEWANSSRAVASFKPGLVDTDMVRGFMELSSEDFPARQDYEDYLAKGQIAAPFSVAAFASWLLLDVPTGRFVDTEWDIRDVAHHHEWATSPLYPDAN